MTKDEIAKLIADAQARFNKNAEDAKAIEEEQLRLQGEYRLLQSQLDKLDQAEAPDPATTVEAKPEKEASSGGRSK